MGTVGDFVIDSVIKEGGKIKGFAVYPLYGATNFKSIRMLMVGSSLNTFRAGEFDILLHNPTNSDHEFYKIIIEEVDIDEFPIIREITDKEVLKIFTQLPEYQPLPGDAI